MEDDKWSFGLSTSSSSRSYQSVLKSLSDLCIDFEEIEEEDDDELRTEYQCPYCTDDFDLVELCSHVDEEHYLEAKSGVCPVCFNKAGMDMVDHITTEHQTIYKNLQKLKLQKGKSHLNSTFLKKELEDGYLQALLSGSSSVVSPSNLAPDPLLSFLCNVPPAEKYESAQPSLSSKVIVEEKNSDVKLLERNDHLSPLSDEEHMEKARRSEFVQGLLLSTIFDDGQ
ncbi:drought-responsive family protein [Salix suchowensis]|nr:drought-responsive family protein [Salix suchowensis]